LPQPTFENHSGGFLVSVYAPDIKSLSEKVGEKVGERVGERVGEKLTENQALIINCLNENIFSSAKEIAMKIGVSQRKVEENIAKLKKKGLLNRIGPAKGGYWQVIKPHDKPNK
jgi:ATP-dependent DNA helicase RecG